MLLKNEVLKVMVTCRSYVYNNVSESLSSLSFAHYNLLSDEIKLSLVERKEISKLYLTDDIVSHLNDETIMMYNFFPLLCVMFKGKKMGDIDFFQNINQFLKIEIGNFKRKKDATFMALALLVLSNNSIENECLQIGKDKYDIMLKDLYDEIDNKNSPSKTSILSNLRNLKNMYLTETDSTFCTKHDKIFDIISHTVGHFIIGCILRHGESSFISSRCQLSSLNEQHDVCTIMITDEFETMYFQRVLEDTNNGQNWEVFASIQMKFEKYRSLLIQYLEKSRKKLHSSNTDCTTPLHVTAAKGYYDISKYLIEKNRNQISSLDNKNRSPLHNASLNGHHEIVHLLLSNGAKINQSDNEKCTPLLESCINGYVKVVEILLNRQAHVNKCDKYGWSPLHLAASGGNTELILLLMEHGADVNVQLNNGMTPIYIASDHDNLEAVKILLSNKANINKPDETGWSPLHIASYVNHNEIAKLLLENGAEVNSPDKHGQTSLYSAAENGNTDLIEILIGHDADVNFQTNTGISPMYKACKNNHLEQKIL
ncbi:ankyrin-3-like [Mytilus edulis]|uniref:ankyrin-3-like n=1 Tax=Mytilus edulis TaxID=6550 RepID=UPI0039EE21A0